MQRSHRMPFGAELVAGGVRFCLWAPSARQVELALDTGGAVRYVPMSAEAGGWYRLETGDAQPGSRYRFRIDGELLVPDPASRFQPEDVHGPSEVIDPHAFSWRDAAWTGRPWEEAALYELHVGSFTPEGTFAGVERRLDHLAALGVTAVELMPLADFPGRRNWGYDGVLAYAPDSVYGRPEDLKQLIQAAHARDLMVFLDVVYNHFGPEGNYLSRYAAPFFTERHKTPWGAAIDFDGASSRSVRDFYINNALYWLEEYHFDGLRFDAVHAIYDDSSPHILDEIAAAVARGPGAKRRIHLVLENDKNEAHYLERNERGRPRRYTAQWNDDIHHAMHVIATGEDGGYYADYADAPLKHLGRCLTEGFAYQGDASRFREGAARGESSANLPLTAFIAFLQNHDQIGNRAFGERITMLTDAGAVRALAAVFLLAPSPPLLFMGEEWAARQPFPFFCDFGPELARAVTEGRRQEFARFPQFGDAKACRRIPDPNDPATFALAVLDWDSLSAPSASAWLRRYRELLALRAREIAPRLHGLLPGSARYDVLGDSGIRARWRLGDGAALTLYANLGRAPMSEDSGRPDGRLLHATHEEEAFLRRELPPWSVYWFLDNNP